LKTLIVMPTYNEIENLKSSIEDIFAHVPTAQVLVVDDCSPDGTGQLADSIAGQDKRVQVLHRRSKDGLGAAYLNAFEWALQRDFELVVEMDADGSHRAADLGKLLDAATTADLVIGSRWISGGEVLNWPARRKLISKLGNSYARLMLRTGIYDMTAGFRVFKTSFLRNMNLSGIAARGYAFQVEMALRVKQHGGVVKEVPITFIERNHGASKMTTAIVLEALWLVTKWGFYKSA
jgi:dolichol-phosphate mannosyltransferase